MSYDIRMFVFFPQHTQTDNCKVQDWSLRRMPRLLNTVRYEGCTWEICRFLYLLVKNIYFGELNLAQKKHS